MKSKAVFFLIISIVISFVVGCNINEPTPEPTKITEKVKLYYGDSGNEQFVTEEREITYLKGEDKYKVILEELIKGPTNKDFRANISKDTKVYGTIKQGNDLIVNLSKEFNQFSGSVAEIIGVGSVVNTMAQLENIEQVKILVEGNELIGPSGESRGFMQPFTNNADNARDSMEVTLYFANENATAVVGEKRTIQVSSNANQEELLKSVLEELIKGPENPQLYKTIPREVTILSIKVIGNIAYVDFSEEMHTKHWHGATGEAMTIASIANTLTEFDNIDYVKMTVAGQPMNIEHAILEEPVGRNENMIAK